MKFQRFNAGLVALCALVVGACGDGSADELDSRSAEVADGVADGVGGAAHNFSVGITTEAGAVCSGTLIAPNLVLTARHCVDATEEPDVVTCEYKFSGENIAASTLHVSTSPRLFGAKRFYKAQKIVTPTALEFCGNDIALVLLEENIPSSEARPAIPVVFPMTDRTKIGGKIAAMGYGITNPSAQDSGVRRVRQNIGILCLEDSEECTSRYVAMIDGDREFVTEGYVCAGDSGGGAFEQTSFSAGGAPYVLGALSRGPETEQVCLAAIYSRTDAHARMIVAAGKQAAARGGYAQPEWLDVALAPEPANPPCDTLRCQKADAVATTPGALPPLAVAEAGGCSAAPARASMGLGGFAFACALGLAALHRRRRAP